MGEDLEDQENISPYPYPNDNNYAYDEQGRLTQDILAGIGPDGISWNLQDKVRSVTRDPLLPNNGSTPDLEFRYGATGHRTVKVMKPRSAGVQQPASNWERTYYIHDAQGNPMAIYRRTYGPNVGTYNYMDIIQQEDALLYGSKRLGNWHGGRLKQRELNSTTTAMTGVTYATAPDWTNGQGGYPATALSVTRELGLRHYELSNHLGNVLSTVSDRRLAMGSGSLVSYYRADEKSYADYDPYGMLLPGRFGGGFADQNFGFQGQLKDDQLHVMEGTSYAFEYRVHDPRVGRFLSIDPLAQKYPYYSCYSFSGNRTIDASEFEGLEPNNIHNENGIYGVGVFDQLDIGRLNTTDQRYTIGKGDKKFQICPLITGEGSMVGYLATRIIPAELYKGWYNGSAREGQYDGPGLQDAYVVAPDKLAAFIQFSDKYYDTSNDYEMYDMCWGELDRNPNLITHFLDPRYWLAGRAAGVTGMLSVDMMRAIYISERVPGLARLVARRGWTANPENGTTWPRNLREILAVREAASNPGAGKPLIRIVMTDSRWPASEGWVKMQMTFGSGEDMINVHYVRNTVTGAIDDFKIKLP
jgi:RHS repeat-associated protein